MIIVYYKTKKELKKNIGNYLRYRETSIFGEEYLSNGTFNVSNRPTLTPIKGAREFFATVTMQKGKISKVD